MVHCGFVPQLLLIADPKPLVERLGPDFFRNAPEHPGVYLMRDAAGTVLYVGKAKNLRQRMASYRVANPERLKRRHLRLLRAVERIDFESCPDESSALARESELLRQLHPRFNRAGVWPGPLRFLAWRVRAADMELAVLPAAEPAWQWHGPMGAGAIPLRAALVRLVWCVLRPDRGLAGMPQGWFHGRFVGPVVIRPAKGMRDKLFEIADRLSNLFSGDADPLVKWFGEASPSPSPFEQAVMQADLETLADFASRRRTPAEPD